VSEQTTIYFVVRGPIARPDLSGLCDRLCALIAMHGAASVVCDVVEVAPDAVAVDALARLRLAACRCGCAWRVRGWSDDLRELVALMGLQDILRD
jgi:ABC-type transporter Mla MlaB component